MKFTNLILLVALTFISTTVYGQQRRVGATAPAYPQHESFIPVYEYESVDVQPKFPGGQRGLINYINKIREYPCRAYSHKIEGRVICSFIVNPDGTICEIEILKGVEESLNREAIRIIRNMPRWKAGEIDNEPVHVRCILPIAFRL